MPLAPPLLVLVVEAVPAASLAFQSMELPVETWHPHSILEAAPTPFRRISDNAGTV